MVTFRNPTHGYYTSSTVSAFGAQASSGTKKAERESSAVSHQPSTSVNNYNSNNSSSRVISDMQCPRPVNRYIPKIPPFQGGENVTRLTLGCNRSIFFPGSSVGSTITFGIVEDTSSNPTSNISFKRSACACVLF